MNITLITPIVIFGLSATLALANAPPSVTLLRPFNGDIFTVPTNITMIAQAHDMDGPQDLAQVDFFAGMTSLGVRTNFPMSSIQGGTFLIWSNVPAGIHTLTARVRDRQGALGTSAPVVVRVYSQYRYGVLNREVYRNLPGIRVEDLLASPDFPHNPSSRILISIFETPSQFADNYGQRISGYVIPPVTGEYRFYMAADDQAELWLSTNKFRENLVRIAKEPTWKPPRTWYNAIPETPNISMPIALKAGQFCYVEALHKEAIGGDNFAVAWQMPGEPPLPNGAQPIPSQYLAIDAPIPPQGPPIVWIQKPATNSVFAVGKPIEMSILAYDPGGMLRSVEVFAGDKSLGWAKTFEVISSANYFLVWSNAPVGQHVLRAIAVDNSGLSATSAPVTVTVTGQPPPLMQLVRRINGTRVTVQATPTTNVLVYAVEERIPLNWRVAWISHEGIFDAVNRKVKFGPFFDSLVRPLAYEMLPLTNHTGRVCLEGVGSANGTTIPVTGDSCFTLPYHHPADQTPRDWRLTMSEVTTYAYAWRRGSNWVVAPSPIPMDYVTRAGALWRGGEFYTMNPLGTAPTWWIKTNQTVIAVADGDPPSATRVTSFQILNRDPVAVTINVAAGPSTLSYAVTERIPPGGKVTEVGQDGTLDAASGEIRWGPFFDSIPRNLVYSVVAASPAPEGLVFEGAASFDGHSIPVNGTRVLEPPASLQWVRDGESGKVRLHLRSRAGAVCQIEQSIDLVHWEPVGTVTNSTGWLPMPADWPDAATTRYFRARELK